MSEPLCETKWFTIDNVSSICAYAILYYNYFLTLPMEIDWFWCAGPHTWASAIFMVNRYIAVLGHIPFFFQIYGDPCKTKLFAPALQSYHSFMVLILTALTAVLLTMRVYALYLRNKWVLSLVVLEFAAGVVVACWVIYRVSPNVGSTEHAHMQAGAFAALLVFDFTVFVLTMARSITLWTRNEPFIHRVFMDGLLYYSVIWNCNLVNIIILSLPNPLTKLSTVDFTNILSVVMVSRLMINLRDPTLQKSETVATTNVGYISTFVDDALSPVTMATTQTQTELNQSSYAV